MPIFSKGYAHSEWCLLELAQIVECHRYNGQMILPIFFHVKPSHVRNQTGSFAEAFREHEKNFEPLIIESWREALRVVGNVKGEVIDQNMDQGEIVELVVKRVLDELVCSTHLAECKHPIGIDSRVKDVLSLSNIGSKDVQFVGICGSSGIGKTTIAKAAYNRIRSSFNRHSFISDVKDQAKQCMGLAILQKRLLKDIFRIDFDIGDYHKGKKLIEQRLCKENVLLVLDDVDSKEQIDALAGELNWFGQGSRIIITTTAEHILNVAKVNKDKIYWPELLDREESLRLFSLHAFSIKHPPRDYMQISRDAASYSGGMPSTLEVLGSQLSGTRNKEVWKNILQKLNAGSPISNLVSLRRIIEDTCVMKDNPSVWRPLLHGNTMQREDTVHAERGHMSYGNTTTTFARESKSTGKYLNPNGFTINVRVGKWLTIHSNIRAALSKLFSTATDRVGGQFRISEIRAATKNFDKSLEIGRGGFAIVYKGKIDGTLAAIKRANQEIDGVGIGAEIEMLSKLKHKHVVSMIGFCKEKKETILVIEYMENGTLRDHLYGKDLPPLSWKQRLEICIGVARGLHYLHTWAESGVIHRDVKSNNILLDENFVPKIADFGVSRTGPALDHTHHTTVVVGTIGYLDPEYFRTLQLTKRCDVYAFGVVLFEVVCARPPIHNSLSGCEIHLVSWALQRQGSLETIVDRRLEGNYCPESLKIFGEVAEMCVALEGKNRPTMGDVLWHLEYILQLHEAWLRSNAAKESNTLVATNVELGETEYSQNPASDQENECCIEFRTDDDEEPRTWGTSELGGTIGSDEFSQLGNLEDGWYSCEESLDNVVCN